MFCIRLFGKGDGVAIHDAGQVRKYLQSENRQCLAGLAEDTGLDDGFASVVYGEAMLTMYPGKKRQIIQDATRLLKEDGCYGIHEAGLIPDDTGESLTRQIQGELSSAIHIGHRLCPYRSGRFSWKVKV